MLTSTVNPWIPSQFPKINIPYSPEFYQKIKKSLTSRKAELETLQNPSHKELIRAYQDQIHVTEIVRRLHENFEGRMREIVNSWWGLVKLERAPDMRALYPDPAFETYFFHFTYHTGNTRKVIKPKSEQMKNMLNKLKSLVHQFNEGYEIAFEYNQLDDIVKDADGCFEGQVEGVYLAAVDVKQFAMKKLEKQKEDKSQGSLRAPPILMSYSIKEPQMGTWKLNSLATQSFPIIYGYVEEPKVGRYTVKTKGQA